MANKDRRYGFIPAYTTHGGPPNMRKYYTDGSAAIYIGDCVTKVAGGQVKATTADTELVFGVAASFTESTAVTTEVQVYDDTENTIFQAQCAGSTIAGSCLTNLFYDLNIGTASTVLQSSEMEVADGGSTQDTILVIDKVDREDNAWGLNVDVYCKIHVNPNNPIIVHTSS